MEYSKIINKIINQKPISDWDNFTFKDLKGIQIDGNDIDLEFDDSVTEKTNIIDSIKDILNDGDIMFKLPNGEISFSVKEKKGKKYLLSISDYSGDGAEYVQKLGRYDTDKEYKLTLNIDEKNINIKKGKDDNYIIDVNINKNELGKIGKTENIIIKNVNDFLPYSTSDDNKEEKETDEKEEISFDDLSKEEIAKIIANDETLKQAFFQKPNFLRKILNGEPRGILPAKRILSKYFSNKGENNGKNIFKKDSEYYFEILDESINYDGLKLNNNKEYMVKVVKISTTSHKGVIFLGKDDDDNEIAIKILRKIEDSFDKDTYRVLIANKSEMTINAKRNATIKKVI